LPFRYSFGYLFKGYKISSHFLFILPIILLLFYYIILSCKVREALKHFLKYPSTCLPTSRYEKDGIRGLEDRSRTPKNIPHKIKTDDKDVKRAIEIKKRLMTFSVKRLKEMFKLRYSPNTLHRIFQIYLIIGYI